jgi:arylsulfatase A-like enzyme
MRSTRIGRLLGTSALSLLVTSACTPSTSRPNVVLVSIDTLRADHLGVYGYPRATSPVIDRFAADATVFEHAYSQSPKTAPSHMTLLTGLYPEAHGVRNWDEGGNDSLADGIPTLASLLAENDYWTVALTDFGHVHPALGFDRGFQSFQRGGGARRLFEIAEGLVGQFAERAGDGGAKPFFLFLHTYEVHDPYTPPARLQRLFTDPEYEGGILSSAKELREVAGAGWSAQHEAFWSRVDREKPEDLEHLRALYDAEIRFTDRQLRRLLDALREHGLLESTIVVLVSDHGEEFGEHAGVLHNSLYQEVLHVPLVIRFPGAEGAPLRGTRIPGVVSLVDLMPTLLEWIGLPVPGHVQGRSFLPWIRGAEERGAEPVLSQWPLTGLEALRVGELKYIRGGEREELYDLATDAAEARNLLSDDPARAEPLRASLDDLMAASRELRAGLGERRRVELEDETRQQLEALGYVAGPE